MVVWAAATACRTMPPAADPPSEALAHYAAGLARELHGDLPAAIRHYREALPHDAGREELLVRLALGYGRLGETETALSYSRALTRRPEAGANAWRLEGMLQQSAGHMEQAAAAYREVLRHEPDAWETRVVLARMLLQRQDPTGALAVLSAGLEAVENAEATIALLAAAVYLEVRGSDPDDARETSPDPIVAALERAAGQPDTRREALWMLFEMHGQLENREAFEAAGRRLEVLIPDDAGLAPRLALAYMARDRPGDALRALETARNEHEDPGAATWLLLGRLAWGREEQDRAIGYFRAAKATPDPPVQAFLWLGLLEAERDSMAGEASLQEGLEHHPGNPDLADTLAALLTRRGAWTEALEVIETQATRQDPPVPGLSFIQAALQHMSGNEDAARRLLRKLETYDHEISDHFVRRYLAWDQPETVRAALAFLEDVQALLSVPAGFHEIRGLLWKSLKEYQPAYDAFHEAWKTGGDTLTADFFFLFGAVAERTGRYGKATDQFRRCLDHDPDHADAMNYLAYMWAERAERLEEALALSRRSLELDPDNGAYIDTLGWIYYQQGRYAEALETLRRAHERMPEDATITDHLGDAYYKMNQTDTAIQYWRRAAALDPDLEGLSEKLSRYEDSPAEPKPPDATEGPKVRREIPAP